MLNVLYNVCLLKYMCLKLIDCDFDCTIWKSSVYTVTNCIKQIPLINVTSLNLSRILCNL